MVSLAKTFLFGRELTLWEAGAGIWQGLRAISPIVSITGDAKIRVDLQNVYLRPVKLVAYVNALAKEDTAKVDAEIEVQDVLGRLLR
jgi:hypothetical protein